MGDDVLYAVSEIDADHIVVAGSTGSFGAGGTDMLVARLDQDGLISEPCAMTNPAPPSPTSGTGGTVTDLTGQTVSTIVAAGAKRLVPATSSGGGPAVFVRLRDDQRGDTAAPGS